MSTRQDGPLLVGAVDQDTPGKIVPLLRNAAGELIVTSGGAAGADVDLISVGGAPIALGEDDMAGSLPVVIASDQSPVPITGTVTAVTSITNPVTVVGNVAANAADSGNPVKVGFIAYSPDGTTPGTAVAELDRSNAKSDLDGRQFVNTQHPRWWSYHSDGSSALTDAAVAADPGDGFQVVVTSIIFSTGAATACNIFFEEGASKVLGPWYLEAVAGRGVVWIGKKFITPSTALTVTTSAAIAQSVDVQGYIQAV